MLKENTKAKTFELADQNGKVRNLTEFVGKWIVLYFYPKDNTPGCTKEACNFRDSYHQLLNKGVEIIGVSKDSVASHKKFADKFELNFTLLSDPSGEMIKVYEAWGEKKFMGRTFEGILRVTYLIDPSGMIRKSYPKVNPLTHAGEIIRDAENVCNC